MMKKSVPAANPDAYVAGISGWQRPCVESLRAAVRAAGDVEEVVKWGHLVYLSNGPLLLIRAEDHRVLFGFWRGKRLLSIDGRLKASGKYELANLELREGMSVSPAIARRLTKEAIALNKSLGNPQSAAKTKSAPKAKRAKRVRRSW
jgi:hypothetical protein